MQAIIQTLQDNLLILTIICGIFGLLLGSFLNVVIFRYPIMLFREWETMAKEILQDRGFKISAPAKVFDQQPEKFNLVVPRSACPNCERSISSFENIPVISYLLLKGRCKGCNSPISIRYPFIEIITAASFAMVAWHFGLWLAIIGRSTIDRLFYCHEHD
ncbi:MAG: prepilin peptidase [Enterobacterales bacterium]|nr:prepilin peptidase [Enterobacterales bacterium]